MCFFRSHPDKKDNDNFCISSREKIKTLETLNTRLKYVTEKNGLPIITMYDLRDMYVWILLEKDCPCAKCPFPTFPWKELRRIKLSASSMKRFAETLGAENSGQPQPREIPKIPIDRNDLIELMK